ncbi:MAG: hypothetical protein ACK5LT_12470 [Lachnospirales bacterium]
MKANLKKYIIALGCVGILSSCGSNSEPTDNTQVNTETTIPTETQGENEADTNAEETLSTTEKPQEYMDNLLKEENIQLGDGSTSVWAMLDNAVGTLENFTTGKQEKDEIYIEKGIGYYTENKKELSPEEIFSDPKFDELKKDKILMRFIVPNDFKGLKNVSMNDMRAGEWVFFYDYGNGYLVGNDDSLGGIISYEELDTVMENYEPREIEVFSRDSTAFMDMEYQAAYELDSLEAGIDTRYCAGDGNYGIIVTSKKGLSDKLHGYLYDTNGTEYNIVATDFQDFADYKETLAKTFPNLNPEIFPDIDYYWVQQNTVSNLSVFSKTVDESNLMYGAGIGNLYYMEFDSGYSYVVVEEKSKYNATQVSSIDEAKKILEDNTPKGEAVPYVILKQY